MKTDVVQSLAGGIIAQQFRGIGIGQPPQLQRLLSAQLLAQRGQHVRIPTGLLTLNGFMQWRIGQEQITVAQRLRLIKNGVCIPDHWLAP
ncbi:hypothetical protein D3C71_1885080 [compost metagenome]